MKELSLVIFFLATFSLCAQYPAFNSVSGLEHLSLSNVKSVGEAIRVDRSGNKIFAGGFYGTVDFDFSSSSATASEYPGLFVSKYDSSGSILWVKTISNSSEVYLKDMEIDSLGNIYICGYYDGGIDFDPGPGVSNYFSNFYYSGFVVKLDSNGIFEWANDLNSSISTTCYDLVLDDSANVYTVGYFVGALDLDPGINSFNVTSIGRPSGFLQKVDTDGNFVWAHTLISTNQSPNFYESIAIDTDQNLVLCGWSTGFYNDFDPGTGTVNLPVGSNTFVQKLSKNDDFIWVKGYPLAYSGLLPYLDQVTTDEQNNIYYTGAHSSNIDFDPDPTNVFYLPFTGLDDNFVVKFDASGNFIWAKSFGTDGVDGITCLITDHNSNIYIGVRISGEGDLDPGPGTAFITTNGGVDACLISLNSSGDFRWVYHLSGAGNSWSFGKAIYDITLNHDNSLLFTGVYMDSADFDNGPGLSVLELPAGDMGAYCANIERCVTTNITIIGTGCTQYISPITNKTYYSSGIYEDTIYYNPEGCGYTYLLDLDINQIPFTSDTIVVSDCTPYVSSFTNKTYSLSGIYEDTTIINSQGCGHTHVLDIEINQVDVSTTTILNLMSANNTTAQFYQWIDCQTMTSISGANAPSYAANANGEYAVIIDDGNCLDTSECIVIQGLNVDENINYKFSVFPNPTFNSLLISIDYDDISTLEIYNSGGKLLLSQNISNQFSINTNDLPQGIYFVSLKSPDFKLVTRFVKK
ncbi:hypothetical protein DNU06_15570 [Putridiphycobacter roseus]|uniref:Secretion system C-terminal sorting domain-containing protein n=1 Tax=Putridiphycobacter roseus TaxID=2219161 RepID=A0A2W1NCX9_9FLAO|nr:T9SS type A sorting domain-containing protein [Putridiphycobacter roseus]PZE15926.1 hypothetical protein DNU06_15570 [Putridiphycobacter roseus]